MVAGREVEEARTIADRLGGVVFVPVHGKAESAWHNGVHFANGPLNCAGRGLGEILVEVLGGGHDHGMLLHFLIPQKNLYSRLNCRL